MKNPQFVVFLVFGYLLGCTPVPEKKIILINLSGVPVSIGGVTGEVLINGAQSGSLNWGEILTISDRNNRSRRYSIPDYSEISSIVHGNNYLVLNSDFVLRFSKVKIGAENIPSGEPLSSSRAIFPIADQ